MNPRIILPLTIVLLLPGCFGRKKESKPQAPQIANEVDIPVAGQTIKSFFDDNLNEFVLIDDEEKGAILSELEQVNDYDWIQKEGKQGNFKLVYFDFDNFGIKENQEDSLTYDLELLKKEMAKNPKMTLVIEGHACHSAGSAAYNLALSEKRAKAIVDRLIACGIPRGNIKLVGRGQEVPAVVNGKRVSGNRQEQWANRRGEFHIV